VPNYIAQCWLTSLTEGKAEMFCSVEDLAVVTGNANRHDHHGTQEGQPLLLLTLLFLRGVVVAGGPNVLGAEY
jgi:hypothetical protein